MKKSTFEALNSKWLLKTVKGQSNLKINNRKLIEEPECDSLWNTNPPVYMCLNDSQAFTWTKCTLLALPMISRCLDVKKNPFRL